MFLKRKLSRLVLLICTLMASGCRSLPNDVNELIAHQQYGMVWVDPSQNLLLIGDNKTNQLKSHEQVVAKFDKGGAFAWSDSPSIQIYSSEGVSKIKIPSDFINNHGKVLPPELSGQPYQIRFVRFLDPTREWVKLRKEETPIYTTITTAGPNGTVSTMQIQTGTITDYYNDHYMDGEIEYRVCFYDARQSLVAIIYLKKPVQNFLKESTLSN